MDFDRIGINVVDEEAGVLTTKYLAGVPVSGITVGLVKSLEGTETKQVMTTRQSMVQSDFASDRRFPRDQDRLDAGLRSGIRVPLIAKGRVNGSLFLRSHRVGAYGPREQRVLERLAAQIAPAVENSELYGQIKSHAEEMAAVDEIARILTSTLDIDQVYEAFANEVKKIVDFDRIAVNIINEANFTYTVQFAAGTDIPGRTANNVLPLKGQFVERLLRTHNTVISPDLAASTYYDDVNQSNGIVGLRSAMAIPLLSASRIVASLSVLSLQVDAYGAREQRIMERLASQIAPAIENAKLYETSRHAEAEALQRSEELEALFEIASILGETGDFRGKVERVTQKILEIAKSDSVSFRSANSGQNGFELLAAASEVDFQFSPPKFRPFAQDVISEVFQSGKAVVINDYPTDYRTLERFVARGFKSVYFIPVSAGGQTFGVLTVGSVQAGHFTPDRVRLLTTITDGLGTLLQNFNLSEELHASSEEIAVADRVSRILSSTLNIDDVYEQFAAEVKKLLGFDHIGIYIVDEPNHTYVVRHVSGLEIPTRPVGGVLSLEGTNAVQMMQTHQSVISHFLSSPFLLEIGLKSAMSIPLISSGRMVASISVLSKQLGAYGPREQRIMERLASQIAPAIENAQLYEKTKLAGEATRASEEKYRTLVNESPDTIVVSRIDDYRITEVNDRACDQYGYSVKEFQAMNIFDLEIGPPLPEQVRSLYDNTPIGQVVEVYGTNKRKDGTTFPVHVRFAKLDDVFAIANVRDITAQRTAEQSLRESEAQFRQIAENMRRVVFLVDHQDYSILYVNEAFEKIWGCSCQSIYDNPMVWLDAVHPDDRPLVEAALSIQQTTSEFEEEFRIIRPDGAVRWIFDRVFPVKNEAGEVYRLVGIAEDITVRKETEQRMNETARLAAIGELAAGVAHEINNPLTGVLGYSELLLAEDLPKQTREDLQKVHSNAQRAAKVVQNLLSFSRKQEFRARYMDLTTVVARVLDMKSYDLTTSNIQVTQELSPDLPHTMMDEHQLIQAIVVLLTNAEQALRGFRRDGSVVVRTTHSESHIRLSITDNGPGIAPEVLTRIFEPFFTTKEVGEGTGLGLSICYGIVRQHDGNIWAESVPGEGSSFHIELPIVRPEIEDDAQPPQQQRQTHAPAEHLLVVDDEPHIRELLVRVLEKERYTVDLAEEGGEAWNMLMTRSYDCIVLDLKMPGVGGQELYQRIKESDYRSAKKVIFITGDTISKNTQDFIISTGNTAVSKPLDMDVLLMQVRKCLEATRNAR